MGPGQEPEVRPTTIQQRPDDTCYERQSQECAITQMNARKRGCRDQHLKKRRTDQHGQPTMEQALKGKLLRQGPNRIQRKETQNRRLPDQAVLIGGESHYSSAHDESKETHRYQTRRKIVAPKPKFVPRVRTPYDEIDKVCSQGYAGSEK